MRNKPLVRALFRLLSFFFALILFPACPSGDNFKFLEDMEIRLAIAADEPPMPDSFTMAGADITDINGNSFSGSATVKTGTTVTVKVVCSPQYELEEGSLTVDRVDYIKNEGAGAYSFRAPGRIVPPNPQTYTHEVKIRAKFVRKVDRSVTPVVIENGNGHDGELYRDQYAGVPSSLADSGSWQWSRFSDVEKTNDRKVGIARYFGHGDPNFTWRFAGFNWNVGDCYGKADPVAAGYGINIRDCVGPDDVAGIEFWFIRRGTANTFTIELSDGVTWTAPHPFRARKTGVWEKVTVPVNMSAVNPLFIRQIRILLLGSNTPAITGLPAGYAYPVLPINAAGAWGAYHRVFDFNSTNSGFAVCDIKAVKFVP